MTAAWVSSRARTIPFPVPGNWALHGTSVRPFPRAWPAKAPGDMLDYSIDYTAWLSDCADTIEKLSVDNMSVAPATGLTINWAVFVNGIVSLGLSGGQSALRYQLRVTVTTTAGRVITGVFTLPLSTVESASSATELPAPDLTFPAGTITINGIANT